MLSKLFPLLDYIYIFQLLEYNKGAFLNWYFKNPLKRNLQKKNNLDFTPKVQLLAFITSFLMLFFASFFALLFFRGSLLALIFIYIVFESISPFFIVFASILLSPIEIFKKNSLKQKAKEKISKLPNLKTIVITGSYAKTSTKNILYTLLWKDFYVVKTPKSFNTEISIAQTIISMVKPTTQIFLAEMDAYKKGDIKSLCKIAPPDMAIITAIAPQHLERFGSLQNLIESQFEVSEYLNSEDKYLFLNSSDEYTMQYQEKVKSHKVFFSGETDKYRIENIKSAAEGLTFKLTLEKESVEINLPLDGEHNAYNFLAAAVIAHKLGLSIQTIAQRAKLILPTEHRLEITRPSFGSRKSGNLTIIDNSYNTNPKVIVSSLKLLNEQDGYKILITPGLIEQGNNSEMENKKFMLLAASVANEIIIVGESFKNYLKAGLEESEFPKEKTHFVSSFKKGMTIAENLEKQSKVVLIENDLPDQYS